MRFRTCENFGESTDFYLVLSPKFSQIQKPHRHYFDGCFTSFANPADCRLSQNPHDSAESALDSTIPQNLVRKCRISHEVRKSFCYFLLSQKVESSLPYQLQLTSDSTIPQNLTRKAQNHRISHEVRKSFCYFLLIQKVESFLFYQL